MKVIGMRKVIKKDGSKVPFRMEKVLRAVDKSAYRVMVQFTDEDHARIADLVQEKLDELGKSEATIMDMHNVVE